MHVATIEGETGLPMVVVYATYYTPLSRADVVVKCRRDRVNWSRASATRHRVVDNTLLAESPKQTKQVRSTLNRLSCLSGLFFEKAKFLNYSSLLHVESSFCGIGAPRTFDKTFPSRALSSPGLGGHHHWRSHGEHAGYEHPRVCGGGKLWRIQSCELLTDICTFFCLLLFLSVGIIEMARNRQVASQGDVVLPSRDGLLSVLLVLVLFIRAWSSVGVW